VLYHKLWFSLALAGLLDKNALFAKASFRETGTVDVVAVVVEEMIGMITLVTV
jgi:hypothetical protein